MSQVDGIQTTYLIEPCLHDFGRLLGQVASLSSFAMLILVMTGHEESGSVSWVAMLAKPIHGSGLLLVVTSTFMVLRVCLPDWDGVTCPLMVLLWFGSFPFKRPRRVHAIPAGSRRSSRAVALIKAIAHLSSKRILHGSSESAHSRKRFHHGRSRSLIWGLIVSCSFMAGPIPSTLS